MKLSYRDKVIFIAAIIVVIGIAGVFLFIKPAFENMKLANEVLQTKENEKADVEARINSLPELVQQLKNSAEEVKETQSHFLMLSDPYENEQFISEIIKECDLKVQNVMTTYALGTDISEYTVLAKNISTYDLLIQADLYKELPDAYYDNYYGNTIPVAPTIRIGVTTMVITYEGASDEENLFKFIDKLAENDKTIVIPTFGGDCAKEDEVYDPTSTIDVPTGEIMLNLYSLFPLNIDKVMAETDVVEIDPNYVPPVKEEETELIY